MQKFVPNTEEEKEQVLKEIRNIAPLVTKHKGVFVDDFVVNILVPRHYVQTCDIDELNIVTLFFQMFSDSKNFFREAKLHHAGGNIYLLIKFGSIIVRFEIINSPVRKYHIHYLNAGWNDDIYDWSLSSDVGFTVDSLLSDIKRKYLRVLPHETKMIRDGDRQACERLHAFSSKGWNVHLNDGVNGPYNVNSFFNTKLNLDELIAFVTAKADNKVENQDVTLSTLATELADVKNLLKELTNMMKKTE